MLLLFCDYVAIVQNDNALIFCPSHFLLIHDDITLMAGFYFILIGVNANSNNCGYFVAVFMTHSLQISIHCKHEMASTWEFDVCVCVYCDMTHLL